MSFTDFKKSVANLEHAAKTAATKGVDLSSKTPKNVVFDYEASKKEYYKKSLERYFTEVKKGSPALSRLLNHDDNTKVIPDILELIDTLQLDDSAKLHETTIKISALLKHVSAPSKERITQTPSKLPTDIKSEVLADLHEIDKAYRAGCFRSVTILCGRILETALHRKYYEATGVDILEKSPGIGLGNLIGKLNEKGVMTDPALKQQIHLINQVRVFAVHKKLEPFHPSKTQTRAIVLYTNDVLERLFLS